VEVLLASFEHFAVDKELALDLRSLSSQTQLHACNKNKPNYAFIVLHGTIIEYSKMPDCKEDKTYGRAQSPSY
jgi:hypothetical protein